MPHGGSLEFSAPPYRASATRAQWRHRTPSSQPAAGPPLTRPPRAPLPCAPPVSRGRANRSCPVAVRTPRVPWPCVPRVPHCRAHRSCPVAVGRDVPIAPPCPVAVRTPRVPWPCVPRVSRGRAYPACPVAVRTPRAPWSCAPRVPPLRAARCLAATARGGSPPLGSA